ncbi:hypothetical protein GQ54DRAFT_199364 [Martensiomyces pterosporus]|nr:hypothetical protein GQ54DRAFT_199364 [Martensiomyces pterosporus]
MQAASATIDNNWTTTTYKQMCAAARICVRALVDSIFGRVSSVRVCGNNACSKSALVSTFSFLFFSAIGTLLYLENKARNLCVYLPEAALLRLSFSTAMGRGRMGGNLDSSSSSNKQQHADDENAKHPGYMHVQCVPMHVHWREKQKATTHTKAAMVWATEKSKLENMHMNGARFICVVLLSRRFA